MTIVLAGDLQVGPQLPSSLAFLLVGGQLSHALCIVHCALYTTVPCILYNGVTHALKVTILKELLLLRRAEAGIQTFRDERQDHNLSLRS